MNTNNLKQFNVSELTLGEQQQTEGGSAIGRAIGYGIGYAGGLLVNLFDYAVDEVKSGIYVDNIGSSNGNVA